MSSIKEKAEQFFDACETGKGAGHPRRSEPAFRHSLGGGFGWPDLAVFMVSSTNPELHSAKPTCTALPGRSSDTRTSTSNNMIRCCIPSILRGSHGA